LYLSFILIAKENTKTSADNISNNNTLLNHRKLDKGALHDWNIKIIGMKNRNNKCA